MSEASIVELLQEIRDLFKEQDAKYEKYLARTAVLYEEHRKASQELHRWTFNSYLWSVVVVASGVFFGGFFLLNAMPLK